MEANNDFLLFSHISHLLEDTNGRVTRSELEQILHYSGNYINSIVKKYTDLCLFDYGQTFFMKKAAYLLRNTDDSIFLEIMEKFTFCDYTFLSVFQKQYYMTHHENIEYQIFPLTICRIILKNNAPEIRRKAALIHRNGCFSIFFLE